MVEKIKTVEDIDEFIAERENVTKIRDAMQFCKELLEIKQIADFRMKYEERMNFERCLTENFLMKHGMDYFGKRDLIYIDLFGSDDVNKLRTI